MRWEIRSTSLDIFEAGSDILVKVDGWDLSAQLTDAVPVFDVVATELVSVHLVPVVLPLKLLSNKTPYTVMLARNATGVIPTQCACSRTYLYSNEIRTDKRARNSIHSEWLNCHVAQGNAAPPAPIYGSKRSPPQIGTREAHVPVWEKLKPERKVPWSHFYNALHWMQGGLVRRKLSVCPSVRPSVCQTPALWQNGRKISSDFYTIRKTF